LKETLNTMVDSSTASPVGDARGARGRHRRPPRRQAKRAGVAGTWKDLHPTASTRWRATSPRGPQHRRSDHRRGARDLSRKITVDVKGEILELKNTINTMVDQLNAFASK